jgi:ribosomal protein L37E
VSEPAPLFDSCERCGASLAPDAFACTACGLPVVPRMTAAWRKAPRPKPRTAARRQPPQPAPRPAPRVRVPKRPSGAPRSVLGAGIVGVRLTAAQTARLRLAIAAHVLALVGVAGLLLGAYLLGRVGG